MQIKLLCTQNKAHKILQITGKELKNKKKGYLLYQLIKESRKNDQPKKSTKKLSLANRFTF